MGNLVGAIDEASEETKFDDILSIDAQFVRGRGIELHNDSEISFDLSSKTSHRDGKVPTHFSLSCSSSYVTARKILVHDVFTQTTQIAKVEVATQANRNESQGRP